MLQSSQRAHRMNFKTSVALTLLTCALSFYKLQRRVLKWEMRRSRFKFRVAASPRAEMEFNFCRCNEVTNQINYANFLLAQEISHIVMQCYKLLLKWTENDGIYNLVVSNRHNN